MNYAAGLKQLTLTYTSYQPGLAENESPTHMPGIKAAVVFALYAEGKP
jgi:hypothetical protein